QALAGRDLSRAAGGAARAPPRPTAGGTHLDSRTTRENGGRGDSRWSGGSHTFKRVDPRSVGVPGVRLRTGDLTVGARSGARGGTGAAAALSRERPWLSAPTRSARSTGAARSVRLGGVPISRTELALVRSLGCDERRGRLLVVTDRGVRKQTRPAAAPATGG